MIIKRRIVHRQWNQE